MILTAGGLHFPKESESISSCCVVRSPFLFACTAWSNTALVTGMRIVEGPSRVFSSVICVPTCAVSTPMSEDQSTGTVCAVIAIVGEGGCGRPNSDERTSTLCNTAAWLYREVHQIPSLQMNVSIHIYRSDRLFLNQVEPHLRRPDTLGCLS